MSADIWSNSTGLPLRRSITARVVSSWSWSFVSLDRHPVLEGHVRAEDVQDVRLAHRADVDVVIRIVVRPEQRRPRMLAMVFLGQSDDRGVVVYDRRVAGRQLATEHPLAAEERPGKERSISLTKIS